MAEYKIEFVDKVIDSVHGFIPLTQLEKDICNLAIVKRLGKIKQLSFTSWVFPGAEHTRYTHSLGVMHIIDRMAVKLKYTDEERQLLRFSALLHDIGHYPLSHDGETCYRIAEKGISDFDIDPATEKQRVKRKIDGVCENIDDIEIYHAIPTKSMAHHEQMSKKIILSSKNIKKVLEDNNCTRFIDLNVVCAIITGDVEYDNYRVSDMVQLLHSELDADRIDYMMRDGFFSGTSYGDFGVGLLVDNLIKTEVDGKKIIGIKQKGIASGDQFLLNRLLSYDQVMYSHRVSGLAYMARNVMQYGIKNGFMKSYDEINADIINNSIEYLLFTDNAFWNCVNEVHKSYLKGNEVNETIFKFAENLIKSNELEHDRNKDAIFKVEPSYFKENIKNTEIYKNLSNNDNTIPMFLMCDITKHRPIGMFEKHISHLPKDEQDRLKVHRLMDGIAIINNDGDVDLLVDNERSLMRALCNTRLYILREYSLKEE